MSIQSNLHNQIDMKDEIFRENMHSEYMKNKIFGYVQRAFRDVEIF